MGNKVTGNMRHTVAGKLSGRQMEDKPQQAKFQGSKWETHGHMGDKWETSGRQVGGKRETSRRQVGAKWETNGRQVGDK